MAFELKNGSGALFKNAEKKTEKHPDYTGQIKDDRGNLFQLAGWLRESKNGVKFISLAMQVPKGSSQKRNDDFL